MTGYRYQFGMLTDVTYSDTTPDLQYQYHPSGQLQFAHQGTFTSNDPTAAFTKKRSYEYFYSASKRHLDKETITEYDTNGTTVLFTRDLERDYDDHLRPEDLRLKVGTTIEHLTTYGFHATEGRLETVTSDSQTFTYDYTSTRNLINTVTGPVHTVTNGWDTTRAVLLSKENEETVGTATVPSNYAYSANDIGQRTQSDMTGTAFDSVVRPYQPKYFKYAYDKKGQVKGLAVRDVNDDPEEMEPFERAYLYDGIGNRTGSQNNNSIVSSNNGKTTYDADSLNQYDEIILNPTTTSEVILNPVHDVDGNMTSGPLPADPDSNSTLVWDAENRLVEVTVDSVTTVYSYDYLGRRVSKKVGSGTMIRYLYDGWNLCAEYSGATLNKTYTWGMDLSGGMQGAGGVGGLLMVTDDPGGTSEAFYYPTYDGNGNISEYLDESGDTVAHYEYDPFGNESASVGAKKDDFIHRFSTKPLDEETGLYYYGYRYYDPVTGRWPSRDPIEERGGMNLYGMVGNDAVNWTDYLGLLQPSQQQVDDMIETINVGRRNWTRGRANSAWETLIEEYNEKLLEGVNSESVRKMITGSLELKKLFDHADKECAKQKAKGPWIIGTITINADLGGVTRKTPLKNYTYYNGRLLTAVTFGSFTISVTAKGQLKAEIGVTCKCEEDVWSSDLWLAEPSYKVWIETSLTAEVAGQEFINESQNHVVAEQNFDPIILGVLN